MSKTRKTRPYIVKMNSDPAHLLEEDHDHTKGECDLPPKPVFQGWFPKGQNCWWKPRYEAELGENGVCGCPLCTSQYERKVERRRVRHNGKKETRQYRTEE